MSLNCLRLDLHLGGAEKKSICKQTLGQENILVVFADFLNTHSGEKKQQQRKDISVFFTFLIRTTPASGGGEEKKREKETRQRKNGMGFF